MFPFQSPQWGDNSKGFEGLLRGTGVRFSPRNGEIILKQQKELVMQHVEFQSPQWGDNSKGKRNYSWS